MRAVKIADAKNHLSQHLRYVRGGGRVRIFDRDEPVADLVPIADEVAVASGWTSAEIDDLERRGVIRRPTKKGPPPHGRAVRGPSDPRGRVTEALLAERRRGR